MCKRSFHLPCYDVIQKPQQLFVKANIVFLCDACLFAIDGEGSPERKRKNGNANSILKQSTFTANGKGNVTLTHQQPPNAAAATTSTSKKVSNEQLHAFLSSISDKMDHQTRLLNEMGQNVCKVGNDVIATKNKSTDVFNMVQSRFVKRDEQDMRDLAKQMFRPSKQITSQTPTGTCVYSTVVQSKLAVTPRPEHPAQRKRKKTISLVNNATGETVKTSKLPSPEQGKKDVVLGRPIVERQRKTAPQKSNALSKAICVSKFHPETEPEEIENYIIAHTDVKDKTKFKVTKMVKKDADLSQLTFVTFKIDMVPEIYVTLRNADSWPMSNTVRDFEKMLPPKQTLNDFMPTNNATPSAAVVVDSATEQDNAYSAEIMNERMNQNMVAGSSGSDSGSNNNNNNNDPKN